MMRPLLVALMTVGWWPAVPSSGEPVRAAGSRSAAEGPDPLAGRDAILDFRVVDARDGTPLPDVSIVVVAAGVVGATTLATDEDGHCRIAIPAKERRFVGVSARKEGFIPIQVAWSGKEIGAGLPESYTLAIKPGTSIGGTVRDTRGRPIAGAKVYVSLFSKRRRGEREQVYLDGEYHVGTDAQGRWRCSMIPDRLDEGDDLAFRLIHPDYVSEPVEYGRRLPAAELRGMTSVMVMEDGVPLAGRVVNSRGLLVVKARIFLQRPGFFLHPASLTPAQADCLLTESDADGRFRFGHIEPGERRLEVEARGYAPQGARVVVGASPEPTEIRLATVEEMEEVVRLAIADAERSAEAAEGGIDGDGPDPISQGWVVIGVLVVVTVVSGASLISWLWRLRRRGQRGSGG